MLNNEGSKNLSWKNPKLIIGLIAILVVGGIVIVSILRDRLVNVPQWTVTVTGQGKVKYQPDIADINLGVQIDKVGKAEDALNQLNGKMTKVLKAIKDAGIAGDDIQTQSYSLYPQYDFVDNRSILSGYSANQQLLVKLRNITADDTSVAKVIAAATAAGANQVNSVSFEASNIEDLKQQARIKAIEDARQKADGLAVAAGVRLKQVVGWWENLVQMPMNSQYFADGKGGAGGALTSTVTSGSPEIIIEVGVNYRLK